MQQGVETHGRALSASFPIESSRAAAGLVLLSMATALLSIWYGLDYVFPAEWRGSIYRLGTIAFLGLLLAALALATLGKDRREAATANHRLLCASCLVQLSLTLFFNLPTRPAAIAIAATWLVCGGVARVRGWLAAAGVSVALGCVLYVASIVTVPSTTPGADMLPFIAHAIDLFRGGANPYTADYSMIDANPFFYAPVQWLIYLPFRAAGLDMRLLNLLSAAAIIWIVEHRAAAGQPLRIGVYPLLLSPLVLPMMSGGQVLPYWLAVLAFGCLVLDRRWAWAAVVAGVAVGTRQTALVPTIAVMAALVGRVRPGVWLASVGAGAVTVLVIFLPFVLTPGAFDAMFVSGPAQALGQAHMQGNPGSQVALSNILDRLGLASRDSQVEIGLALLVALAARLSLRKGLGPMLAVSGIGYSLAVSANPYLHRYYYVAGLLLGGVGLAAATVDSATLRLPSTAQ